MKNIQMIIFDVDGVITDGKQYIDGQGEETKTISLKDMDALGLLHQAGYKIGCISGEDTAFSRRLSKIAPLDFVKLGCKTKIKAIEEIEKMFRLEACDLCYIGDGKYDIPVMERVGLGICPADAIDEVKHVADVILKRKGGEGCIAECYTLLEKKKIYIGTIAGDAIGNELIRERIEGHRAVFDALAADEELCTRIGVSAGMINNCYQNGGHLFLCGNGGSAADAQHLAAELVGRFYLERRALSAEALSTNTSVLTALANDYDYDMIFARQVEAKASEGDVLIGITTSGTSKNIRQAFQKAKQQGVKTILMTGKISENAEILQDTDCLLAVPSRDTPRIQEMHILMGHIICELVEREIAENIQ